MIQPAGRCCERDFCVFFRVKEGRENETQFCCVLMVVCDAGWICAEIGKNAIEACV